MNDLPLPPPPSPTQLQQYEIYNNCSDNNNINNNNNNNNDSQHTRTLSSLSSMSTGSNTTHSSTQSLSPTPYSYHHTNTLVQQQQQQQQMTHYPTQSDSTHSSLSWDQYGSTSPLHSRQASSSSSSLNYGCNNDNSGTLTTTIPPPPPPPPQPEDNNQDLYINTMKQQHNTNNRKLLMTKQNENDMNTFNKTSGSAIAPATTATLRGGVGGVETVGGAGSTALLPTTQKVYNKFLKEYSNKLLTQGNMNNNISNNSSHSNTLKHSDNNVNNIHSFVDNGSHKPFIAIPITNSKHTQQQQHNHYLQQMQQQQLTNNINNHNNNSQIIKNSLPSVAAITATLTNQLKFDPCQVSPSLLPATTTATTAITPSSSNLSIVDKNLFNNSTCNINQISNNNSNITTTKTTTNEMSEITATGPSGDDKPFEYVTLTGNVIRSVVPPGRGNVNYKVSSHLCNAPLQQFQQQLKDIY